MRAYRSLVSPRAISVWAIDKASRPDKLLLGVASHGAAGLYRLLRFLCWKDMKVAWPRELWSLSFQLAAAIEALFSS